MTATESGSILVFDHTRRSQIIAGRNQRNIAG
jgi:hypothetical protein